MWDNLEMSGYGQEIQYRQTTTGDLNKKPSYCQGLVSEGVIGNNR